LNVDCLHYCYYLSYELAKEGCSLACLARGSGARAAISSLFRGATVIDLDGLIIKAIMTIEYEEL
jgi:hypothetical protein